MSPKWEHLDRPYFVYGTLRPAWGNSRLWLYNDATAAYDGDAYVPGYQMIDHGIPYAVATGNPDHRVVGCLIVPGDDFDDRATLRHDLDQLEGWPDHYDRVQVEVITPDFPVAAWIYTPTTWKVDGPVEPSGDFANCGRGRKLRTGGGWQ